MYSPGGDKITRGEQDRITREREDRRGDGEGGGKEGRKNGELQKCRHVCACM